MDEISGKVINSLKQFRDRFSALRPDPDTSRPLEWLDSLCMRSSPKSVHDYQHPRLYYPGLSDTAWHEPDAVPFCQKLARNYRQIREEFMTRSAEASRSAYTQNNAQFITGTEWRAAVLKRWYFNDEETDRYPVTAAVLRDADVAETAMFSVLRPGGKILPHCAPWNTRLTLHLGLSIPPDCEIRVADEVRAWKSGEVLAFDDSFEHEVWNRSSESRAILLVDVWHPDLTPVERAILEPMLKLLDDDYNGSFTVENAMQDIKSSFARLRQSNGRQDLTMGEGLV
ncbi:MULTISPECIES: aspartyl/asparaginyl beta-hydroxylase domain-containing protein [Burkholderiaceae]|uniref:Aspartyl/asparaginy/proline hydroxylase domain-containing protein n=1 Tax=Paraburkholderia aromaticivorans TaxID=2026199 RepID=A0A248VZB9_9BURK|nr:MULTISPECIES: aspartyl/asparaginyl beta-hydroxylase domain-containing protein [Burkholderiaceae]ASW03740.1 hypothetical protein CJU94_36730 [Paraburkholderia aromaticivorans]MBR8008599.1 aspartyl/asparaginyl beta-hydroxylase domain-containing protein [Burkholderia vietnamiensis]MBR8054660.1 aspartyl/asparaginyl beta-hydroxylase domain-containing protein [Burkholderia vietnamiensis]